MVGPHIAEVRNSRFFGHPYEVRNLRYELRRLWFGTSVEDKQKRLRAFLACLRCDDCPLLLHQAHVPQHMLILACVLRSVNHCNW